MSFLNPFGNGLYDFIDKPCRKIVRLEFPVIDATVEIVGTDLLVQNGTADQTRNRGIQNARRYQIVVVGRSDAHAGEIGQHEEGVIESRTVAHVELVRIFAEFTGYNAFAAPAVDEDNAALEACFVIEYEAKGIGINAPVADDGNGIMLGVPREKSLQRCASAPPRSAFRPAPAKPG